MTRAVPSPSPRSLLWTQAVYVIVSGTLAYGAGYGAAGLFDSTPLGILAASLVMVAAGWWGHSLHRAAHRMLTARARRRSDLLVPLE